MRDIVSKASPKTKRAQSAADAGSTLRAVPNDLDSHLRWGIAATVLLVAWVGGWAATTQLAGAVIGVGTVVVDSNVKKVQHLSGGIVGELLVRDGAAVKEGDIVVRLDETLTRANLGVVLAQLNELLVRQQRLIAERDGLTQIALPAELASNAGSPEIAGIIDGERTLFENRRTSREGQKSQLGERLNQLAEEIRGLESQFKAKSREVEFVNIELREIEKLFAKNLAPLSKRIALNREATRIDGERAQLTAAIAQARAKIAETKLQIIQLDSDHRTEVTRDLREIQAKLSEFKERRIAAEDQLKRVDIRAPQSGVVHQLNIHTVGGVVNAGEAIMLIVPHDERLVIEAKVSPQDISQISIGQNAFVRFTAFNQRTTPEVEARVTRISADLTRDPAQTALMYYVVRLAIGDDQFSLLRGQQLMPGMPAEVYIRTEERTALSYVLKPLFDQTARAFKER